MNLADFIIQYQGRATSYDGIAENMGQCEQLVCVYWRDVLGFNCPMIPAAKDLWTNPTVLESFDQIAVGREQPGDVAVWGASSLINSPEFGHTDIVISPGFLGFDSNWGGVKDGTGHPAAHQVNHNYTDVLGFLRLNKGDNMNQDQAVELARTLRLLAGESVDEANSHVEDDANHIVADMGYAEALAKQLYNGEWQTLANDATSWRNRPAPTEPHYVPSQPIPPPRTAPAQSLKQIISDFLGRIIIGKKG